MTWNWGFAVISVVGFATYDGQVPGIRNPVVTAPITTIGNNNLATSGKSRIIFDNALNYGGMVVIRIPLNRPGS